MNKRTEDKAQSRIFTEAARELGCEDSEERFDAALKRVAGQKESPESPPKKRRKVTEKYSG